MSKRATFHRILPVFALFALFGCSDSDDTKKSSEEGVTLADPDAVTEGRTLGEWAGEWWRWLHSIPASTNPALDETGDFSDESQTRDVYMLAGNYGGTSARTFSMPADSPVFFPIIAIQADNCGVPPEDQLTSQELQDAAEAMLAAVTEIELEIDGHSFASSPEDLADYLLPPTPMSYVVPPNDSLYDAQGSDFEGNCDPSYTTGYFIMLDGFPAGEHTLHFRALSPAADSTSEDFEIDVTDVITAE